MILDATAQRHIGVLSKNNFAVVVLLGYYSKYLTILLFWVFKLSPLEYSLWKKRIFLIDT